MSIGNFPPRVINFNAQNLGAAVAIPATAVNSAAGTSLQICRRVDTTEIRAVLPEGIYNLSALMTFTIADAETFAQQIELQIVRVNGAGAVQAVFASQTFALNRLGYAGAAGVATFANIANVDYTLQCARGSVEISAGQIFCIRALINGVPTGGSTVNDSAFVCSRLATGLLLDKITLA